MQKAAALLNQTVAETDCDHDLYIYIFTLLCGQQVQTFSLIQVK